MRTYRIRLNGAIVGGPHEVRATSVRVALARALLDPGTTRSTGQTTPELLVHETLTVTVERLR